MELSTNNTCLDAVLSHYPLQHSAVPVCHIKCVDPGGLVVVILATGSEDCGFKPGLGRWIFSERKNLEFDFLWKGSKAMGPIS